MSMHRAIDMDHAPREEGHGLELMILLFILALLLFGTSLPTPARGRVSNLAGELAELRLPAPAPHSPGQALGLDPGGATEALV